MALDRWIFSHYWFKAGIEITIPFLVQRSPLIDQNSVWSEILVFKFVVWQKEEPLMRQLLAHTYLFKSPLNLLLGEDTANRSTNDNGTKFLIHCFQHRGDTSIKHISFGYGANYVTKLWNSSVTDFSYTRHTMATMHKINNAHNYIYDAHYFVKHGKQQQFIYQ